MSTRNAKSGNEPKLGDRLRAAAAEVDRLEAELDRRRKERAEEEKSARESHRTDDPAPPPTDSVWSLGSRTVSQAMKETCLSRQELWRLMDTGVLVWLRHGGRGTRLIAWKSIVRHLERLHEQDQEEREKGQDE